MPVEQDQQELQEQLLLDETDQLILAASYLWIMNRTLEVTSSKDRVAVRDEFREQLRSGPLGAGAPSGPLGVEERQGMQDLMVRSTSTPRCLTMLVEACACEPFAEQEFLVPEWLKEDAISELAIAMGAEVDEDDVEAALIALEQGQKQSGSRALFWVLFGAGTVAGIVVAGLAAPAIGAAIGGAMGLSGAAATSAGLAWLGGGAVAAGGYGMAGGITVIAAAGGLVGAGAGAASGELFSSGRGTGEAIKLYATCRCLDRRALEGGPDAAELVELRNWIQGGMLMSARELSERADRAADPVAKEPLEEAAKVTLRLAEALGEEPKWKP